MIFVGGVPLSGDPSSQDLGFETLTALMEHPLLIAASDSFNAQNERKISVSSASLQTSKLVYLFQREFATVDPALVDLVGTDEATTCVGIAIRNSRTGIVSAAHIDFPNVVEAGLSQMLSLVVDQDADTPLDVHIVGSYVDTPCSYDDTPVQQPYIDTENVFEFEGYSYSLCVKIIEALHNRIEKFHIRTLHVLGRNTRWDSEGVGYPIFHGFVMKTSSGSIFPASFDETLRSPDEIIRRIRLGASFEDPNLCDRLLDTYDTSNDLFVIDPCTWSILQIQRAMMFQNASDAQILMACSTSPLAEGPDFVQNQRRMMDYLIHHPRWQESFPSGLPRIFKRSEQGSWIKQ